MFLLWLVVCSDKPTASKVSDSGPTVATNLTTPQRPVESKTAKGVTFTADPNPIKVCDGSGLGITTLAWKAPGVGVAEIHVNAPDGPLLARGGYERNLSITLRHLASEFSVSTLNPAAYVDEGCS